MLRKIKKVVSIILHPKLLKQLLVIGTNGYLYEIGWIESFKQHMPVDKDGNPLPWVTYGFIDFISERLNKTMDVFEYGSGNSTLWLAKKSNTVIAVEHDKQWFSKVKNNLPNNVQIYFEELKYGGNYSKFSKNIGKKFDIVIVDGRDRVHCLISAVESIKEDGVIVLDDSERENYKNGIELLINKGFKKLDFWGISPGTFYKKCTTIFYRNNNCLGI